MSATATPSNEELTLTLSQEIHVCAPLETTFAALLDEVGPYNETHDGKPLAMKLEARPGGRWYRDLGDDNGHFWGVVQAIKRPTLLEICGPLFMSYPVVNNLQYRLSETDVGTLISFRHSAFGFIPQDQKDGMTLGWERLLSATRKRAESAKATKAAKAAKR